MNIKQTTVKGIFVTAVLTMSTMANAATTFDFAAVADALVTDTVHGLSGGERGASSFTFTEGGLTVTAQGFDGPPPVDGSSDHYAYLDSGSAGLGVCQTLTTNAQCSPSSDDNVTYDETLRLIFNQKVTIDRTTFVNGDHGTSFEDDFKLSIDGGAAVTYSLINIFEMDLTGTTFEFYNPNSDGGSTVSNKKQFYINKLDVTAVPVPATVWLFGSGLLGLVGIARRRRI